MPAPYEQFVAGQREFGRRVDAIGDQQWNAPTPDDGWTVTDLVRHLVDEHRWAVALVAGAELRGTVIVPAGADPAADWDDAARGSADAFAQDGALERTVDLERGVTPARQYLDELFVDLVVHAWDLGRAIGYGPALPPELVSAALAHAPAAVAPYATMFERPVAVPAGASVLDQLISYTGRNPNWSAP